MFSFQIQQNKDSCIQRISLLKHGEKMIIMLKIRPQVLYLRNLQEKGSQGGKKNQSISLGNNVSNVTAIMRNI